MTTGRFIEDLADAIRTKSTWPEFPSGITVTEAYSFIPQLTSLISVKRRRASKPA